MNQMSEQIKQQKIILEKQVNENSVLTSTEYRYIAIKNLQEVMQYLFGEGHYFQLRVPKEKVVFNPPLPREFMEGFDEIMMFDISEYSFETFVLNDYDIAFNAGFGMLNPIETTVSIDIENIHFIFNDYDMPLAINLSAYAKDKSLVKEAKEEGVNQSMASFMMNPENAKFFKK